MFPDVNPRNLPWFEDAEFPGSGFSMVAGEFMHV